MNLAGRKFTFFLVNRYVPLLIVGSLGAFAISLSVPTITYIFYFVCSEDGCPSSSFLRDPVGNIASKWPGLSGVFDWDVMMHYCLWYFALAVMYFVLPGKTGEGVVLSNGKRLKYRFNGMFAFLGGGVG